MQVLVSSLFILSTNMAATMHLPEHYVYQAPKYLPRPSDEAELIALKAIITKTNNTLTEKKRLLAESTKEADMLRGELRRLDKQLASKERKIKRLHKLEEKLSIENANLMEDLSVYKSRSAMEVFEERFCYLTISQLKKEAEGWVKSDSEKTEEIRLAEIQKKVKEHHAKFPLQNTTGIAYAEQIHCRELKWIWIFKNRYHEFEVKKLLDILAGKSIPLEKFAEFMGMAYYFLSWTIYHALLSKSSRSMMTYDLTPIPEVSDALSLFLNCYSFTKPRYGI